MKHKINNKGFTLIELVIVIAIIAVLGTAVFLNIRPGDILANSRNSTRKADAKNLATALNKALVNGDISLTSFSGFKSSNDSTAPSTFVVTGSGYVPFTTTPTAKLDINKLPTDPLNGNAITTLTSGGTFGGGSKYGVYFCSNGTEYEINYYLENDTKGDMKTDGGNNDNAYEVGTNLNLCN